MVVPIVKDPVECIVLKNVDVMFSDVPGLGAGVHSPQDVAFCSGILTIDHFTTAVGAGDGPARIFRKCSGECRY